MFKFVHHQCLYCLWVPIPFFHLSIRANIQGYASPSGRSLALSLFSYCKPDKYSSKNKPCPHTKYKTYHPISFSHKIKHLVHCIPFSRIYQVWSQPRILFLGFLWTPSLTCCLKIPFGSWIWHLSTIRQSSTLYLHGRPFLVKELQSLGTPHPVITHSLMVIPVLYVFLVHFAGGADHCLCRFLLPNLDLTSALAWLTMAFVISSTLNSWSKVCSVST